jgi:hypothetical protein
LGIRTFRLANILALYTTAICTYVSLTEDISLFVVTPYYPKHSNTISDSKGTEITIVWCVPDVKGGTPVIDYKVEINTNPPREIITKDTFATIKELKENTKYVVKVYARNVAGYGDPVSKTFVTRNPENRKYIYVSLKTILLFVLFQEK